MEFLSAQRLKSDNIRSLTFGVLMFEPGLKEKIGHECEGTNVNIAFRERLSEKMCT